MVDYKFLRQILISFKILRDKLILNQLIQAIPEIPQKNFAAFTGKQCKDIIFIFLQMLQQMAEYRFRRASVRIQSVSVGAIQCAADNVSEKFFA